MGILLIIQGPQSEQCARFTVAVPVGRAEGGRSERTVTGSPPRTFLYNSALIAGIYAVRRLSNSGFEKFPHHGSSFKNAGWV